MPGTFTYQFDTPTYKGHSTFTTGLYIDGKFVDGVKGQEIDVINPANGKVLAKVAAGTKEDVDIAVEAAQKAFETTWGLNTPGHVRGQMLAKLADLVEENTDEFAALEALDVGQSYSFAKFAVGGAVKTIRYYAGWADKVHGKTIETDENKLAYTRHEPIGVVGQIIPWNVPIGMLAWKIAPALATGNTIVLKPSEVTPLTALRICPLIAAAGFPPGVLNIVNGYGQTVGQAISEHMHIEKIAFTGSALTGRRIMEAAAKSNLKRVTLELGGKSPVVVFNDAKLEEAIPWVSHGIFCNGGQTCSAGSRVYVQSGIYDIFLEKFIARAKEVSMEESFAATSYHGPLVSQMQFNRVMSYIDAGKSEGAKLAVGGGRIGNEGYYVQPTVFTEASSQMKIVREEIFGPVAVVIKFDNEDEIIPIANDTSYGLAASVFTQDVNRAFRVAHKLKAGTTWINMHNHPEVNVPFGGYKQSGIGRELGEYALENYTNVKAVHVNLGHRM